MRKIVCDIRDDGSVETSFIGAHLNKRELLRVLKSIRIEYKRSVRMRYHQLSMDEAKVRAEARAKAEKEKAETEKLGVKNNGDDIATEQKQTSERATVEAGARVPASA